MLPVVVTVFQAIFETSVDSAATPDGAGRVIQFGFCVSALVVHFGYADVGACREEFIPDSTWVKNT